MKKCLLFFIFFNLIFFSVVNSQTTFSLNAKIANRYAFRGTAIQAINYDLIIPLNTDSGLYILRVEKKGAPKWQKKFGINSDQVVTICATPDNGFACYGNIYNAISGNSQLTLFKCDSTGNIQWSKSLGLDYTNNYINANQLIRDSKNNYVITYQLNPKLSGATSQMRIVKFNKDGNIIFQTGFKNLYDLSYQSLLLSSITETFDGGFLIGLTYTKALFGISYAYLLLTGPDGNVVSYKLFNVAPFNAEDYQAPISLYKNNGKYYVIGYYNHYEKGETKEYYYFTSFNKKQQALTATLVPYNRFALERFVTQNKIPVNIIDGYVINAHNLTSVDYTTNEAFINRYDSLGRICPAYSLPDYDSVLIQKDIFSGDEITGVQKSIDSIILTNTIINIQDVHLIKEICSGGISLLTTNNKLNSIITSTTTSTLFPNPAHNTITISIPSIQNQQLQLYNAEGELLQSIQVNSHQITLDISRYKNGFYVIKIGGDQTQFLKFIKQ